MKATKYIDIRKCKNWLSIASLLMVTGCGAQPAPTVPADWKTDCVGRMQVSLPEAVDVAAYPFFRFKQEISEGSIQPQLAFPDARIVSSTVEGMQFNAPHAHLLYAGKLFISHSLTNEQFADLLDGVAKNQTRLMKFAKKSKNKNSDESFKPIPVGDKKGLAWRFGNFYSVFLKTGDHAFMWDVSFDEDAEPLATKALNNVINNLISRVTYQVPTRQGTCIPYAFIEENESLPRNIAMTYRLVEHPDVQITIKDASSARPEPGIRTQNAEPLPVIQSLWDQHLTMFAKSGKNEWPRGGKPVTLAGYKGLSSFVKFIRHDDAVDYGYAAVVRGDPNAKEDTPDLMVYVIRDSHNAKGKEPMPKDEFLKMAQTIAASVKRRPAAAQ